MTSESHGALLSTVSLASRVERAEIEFCTVTARGDGRNGAASFDVGGGRCVYAAAGSPLNKVLGLGLGCPVDDRELEAVEAFYARRHAPVQIELCPLAGADLPARLSRRGYVFQAFENALARIAPGGPLPAAGDIPVTACAGAAEDDEWLHVVAGGFSVPDPAPEESAPDHASGSAIEGVMRQFLHAAVTRYVAWLGGQPAGAGASFVADRVVGIFGTSTLPRFRRKGVQRALVARTISDAAGKADLVIATTEPGSTSQRTFERLGFQVLYTRAILVRA
jgi:hypothetical protein